MQFQERKTCVWKWKAYGRLNISNNTLIEDEEAKDLQPPNYAARSVTQTPTPPPPLNTTKPLTSAEAGTSGLHVVSSFGDVTTLSPCTTSDAGLSTAKVILKRMS